MANDARDRRRDAGTTGDARPSGPPRYEPPPIAFEHRPGTAGAIVEPEAAVPIAAAPHPHAGAAPFTWGSFLLALGAAGLACLAFGLVMDNALRQFGVGVSPWADAAWDASLATLCSLPLALAFWRVGLVTLPHYLMGAAVLLGPLTIASAAALALFRDVAIPVPGIEGGGDDMRIYAATIYVRLVRGCLFAGVFLITFYLVYHRWLGRAPRWHAPADR